MCSFCHENCRCIISLPVNMFLYHPGAQQLTISSSSSSSSIPSRKYLADRAPYFSAGVKCRFVNPYFRQTSTKRLERKVVSHNSIISHNSTPHNTESPAAGLSNGCGNGPVFLLISCTSCGLFPSSMIHFFLKNQRRGKAGWKGCL